jgi:hypothetical protein
MAGIFYARKMGAPSRYTFFMAMELEPPPAAGCGLLAGARYPVGAWPRRLRLPGPGGLGSAVATACDP